MGIDVDVYQSDTSMAMAVRYLTLTPTLYNHPDRKNRKWVVICDDDTFFPSFNALTKRLAQYDHERPMYIGTFSEDALNIGRHGEEAFGGAGVFLSAPMAKIVAESYERCKTEEKIREADTGWGPQGDVLLRKCIYENSETRLTLLNDLWQLDIVGDPSGFYESGMQPLSPPLPGRRRMAHRVPVALHQGRSHLRRGLQLSAVPDCGQLHHRERLLRGRISERHRFRPDSSRAHLRCLDGRQGLELRLQLRPPATLASEDRTQDVMGPQGEHSERGWHRQPGLLLAGAATTAGRRRAASP